jgi:hypothetical protein
LQGLRWPLRRSPIRIQKILRGTINEIADDENANGENWTLPAAIASRKTSMAGR